MLASDLPDDPYLADRLIQYFPKELQDRYAAGMPKHRLAREIITTVAVNRFVDSQGITAYHRLHNETNAAVTEVIRAQLAARSIYQVGKSEVALLDASDLSAPVVTELRVALRRMVERATRWLLANRRAPLDIVAATAQFTDGVREVRAGMGSLLTPRQAANADRHLERMTAHGVPRPLAEEVAQDAYSHFALTIVEIAQARQAPVMTVAEIAFVLADRLGLDQLHDTIVALPQHDRWETMARAALRDDLLGVHGELTSAVLVDPARPALEQVEEWLGRTPNLADKVATLALVCEDADIAKVSVGVRLVRSLLPAARARRDLARASTGSTSTGGRCCPPEGRRPETGACGRMARMRIDLHTHSSVSDGTDTPTQLVRKAAEAGVDVLGLTDHDTFDGLREARLAAESAGVLVLPGLEMSCQLDGASVHLLGYGCDPHFEALLDELARVRVGRSGRLPEMLAKLAGLGMPLTETEIAEQVGASPSLGRPHVADAMVAKGYVRDRQEAFDRYLYEGGPAYANRYSCDLRRGVGLIRRAGGVPVIAHPWGRGRDRELTPAVLSELTMEYRLEGRRGGPSRPRRRHPAAAARAGVPAGAADAGVVRPSRAGQDQQPAGLRDHRSGRLRRTGPPRPRPGRPAVS